MKIALIGYGKMGKAIEQIALEKGHSIVLRINSSNQHELTIENLKKADMAIEFSTPQTIFNHVLLCFKAGVSVVIGTTAWSAFKDKIEQQCEAYQGSMFYASNFSLGVNLFFELNSYLASLMQKYPQYKITLSEIHHTTKLDAPSGTAISLAEGIMNKNKHYTGWANNKITENNLLPIESIRAPDVPGTHQISYASTQDVIEIKHTAINRSGFASGALMAAEWLQGKRGIYTMKDLLAL